jgi:predicted DCC family thiol-disulfide oxidoreductase YuxK
MNSTARLEVYTDGQCSLCQWLRARVEPFDHEGRIEWLDFRDPAALQMAAPRTFQEMSEQMHVRRRTDGRWATGYAAWLEVARVLYGWRLVVPLFSAWPLTWLGPRFYRWLARRRYRLFGVPPPCDPSGGECALHRENKENL